MEIRNRDSIELWGQTRFALIELEEYEESKWVRSDDCLDESGSLTVHQKVKE